MNVITFKFSQCARNMIVSDIQSPNPDYKTTVYATIPERIFTTPVRSRLLCVGRESDKRCTIFFFANFKNCGRD